MNLCGDYNGPKFDCAGMSEWLRSTLGVIASAA